MEKIKCYECNLNEIYSYSSVINLCKNCFTKKILQITRYCYFCKTNETSTGKTICGNCKKKRK